MTALHYSTTPLLPAYSYLSACIGLSRAALMAGKIPATTPTRTLKAKAIARAVILMIGALSVGEKELIRLTSAKEVASQVRQPRMAMTTDSTRIWVKMSL